VTLDDVLGGLVHRISNCAARLSCGDDRIRSLAESFGIEPGHLPNEERERLAVEIDTTVAAAWCLTGQDLEVLLAGFHAEAVPPAYHRRLAHRLGELTGGPR